MAFMRQCLTRYRVAFDAKSFISCTRGQKWLTFCQTIFVISCCHVHFCSSFHCCKHIDWFWQFVLAGLTGVRGATGRTGSTGAIGATGRIGATGAVGFTGAEGSPQSTSMNHWISRIYWFFILFYFSMNFLFVHVVHKLASGHALNFPSLICRNQEM